MQFHPEVVHTPRGKELIKAFVYTVAGMKDWTPASFVDRAVKEFVSRWVTAGDLRTVRELIALWLLPLFIGRSGTI